MERCSIRETDLDAAQQKAEGIDIDGLLRMFAVEFAKAFAVAVKRNLRTI